jgi:hypothetical protein
MLLGFSLQAMPSSLSNHCELLLCQQDRPRVKGRFRFENFWTRIPGFREVVQAAWQSQVLDISPLNILFYRMQRTTKALKEWSKKIICNARLELHMVNEIIHCLDKAQEIRQLSPGELQLWKELKVRVLGLAAIERSRRRQASRITWLKEGDASTHFFHLKANGHKRKNFIPCLKNNNGCYVWSHQEKEHEMLS